MPRASRCTPQESGQPAPKRSPPSPSSLSCGHPVERTMGAGARPDDRDCRALRRLLPRHGPPAPRKSPPPFRLTTVPSSIPSAIGSPKAQLFSRPGRAPNGTKSGPADLFLTRNALDVPCSAGRNLRRTGHREICRPWRGRPSEEVVEQRISGSLPAEFEHLPPIAGFGSNQLAYRHPARRR